MNPCKLALALLATGAMTACGGSVPAVPDDPAAAAAEAAGVAAPEVPAELPAELPVEGVPGAEALPEGVPAEAEAAIPAIADAAPALAAPLVAVEAPAEAAPAEAAPAAAEPKVCFVGGSKAVKFREDANHRATPTALVAAGTEMRCTDNVKNSWRWVSTADGASSGFLPENLIRWR